MSLQRRRTQSLPLKFSSTGLARTSKRSQSLLLFDSSFVEEKKKNPSNGAGEPNKGIKVIESPGFR